MENTYSQYLFLFLLSFSTSPPPPVEASIDCLRFVHVNWIRKPWIVANDYCSSHYGGDSTLANARNAPHLSYFSEICGGSNMNRCWVGLCYKWENYVWRWKNCQINSLPDTIWHDDSGAFTYFRASCSRTFVVMIGSFFVSITWYLRRRRHGRKLSTTAGLLDRTQRISSASTTRRNCPISSMR